MASLTSFFESIQLPLRNPRWSWGAQQGRLMVLRAWQDDMRFKDREVELLPGLQLARSESIGREQRIDHLQQLWRGRTSGYLLIVEAEDPSKRPRVIKGFREDILWPVLRLREGPDKSIVAQVAQPISTASLRRHAQTHATLAAEGTFPAEQLR